jgi:hypothetical protein
MILNLELPQGVTLAYLRGPTHRQWEALVRQHLDSEPATIRYAVGFGCAPDPDTALTRALEALERDPQLVSEALSIPTCAPPDDLAERLANLLPTFSMPPSPPKFKLKGSNQ